MRPHISMNVSDVEESVQFYQRVFGIAPQKRTSNYAKFDLQILNFSLLSGEGRPISRLNHLGIEVERVEELRTWEEKLKDQKIMITLEKGTNCCYARQDKVWFQDPDGNSWEIFLVNEQLPVKWGRVT